MRTREKKSRTPCILCAVVLAAAAALAPAQEKSHDALAIAREKAKVENQRVLLYLVSDASAPGDALDKALGNYRLLGKLLKYEYQMAAVPTASLAGKAVKKKLGLEKLGAPALVVLDTDDRVLATLGEQQMVEGDVFAPERVKALLVSHKCEPVDAREVLADAVTVAKKSKRQVFVYLSAPW